MDKVAGHDQPMTILDPSQWRDEMAAAASQAENGVITSEWLKANQPTLDRLVRAMILGADAFPWPLTIFGETGAGKTCTSLLMCQRSAERPYPTPGRPWFMMATAFVERLAAAKEGSLRSRGTHASTRLYPVDVWNQWASADVAVLDNLDEKLASKYELIPLQKDVPIKCLELRKGRPTIITSNFTPQQLGELYGVPLASRLSAGTICHVTGDKRQRKARG